MGFFVAFESVQAECRLRAPRRIRRILDAERFSDVSHLEEVGERLFGSPGLQPDAAACLEKMHPEPRRAGCGRTVDNVCGFLGLSLLEKNVSEICRALGLNARPLEELAHSDVLFGTAKVALLPAHDASDHVGQRQTQDVALS